MSTSKVEDWVMGVGEMPSSLFSSYVLALFLFSGDQKVNERKKEKQDTQTHIWSIWQLALSSSTKSINFSLFIFIIFIHNFFLIPQTNKYLV